MPGDIILIIEDDQQIGGMVAAILVEAGYRPCLVRDVDGARAEAARGLAPAAVVSDLMVAGSAGPHQLMTDLEAIFPSVPVTLMTGVPPRRRAAMGVVHDHIIEKPFELEELLDSIARMVAPRRA
jgi:DNA-binding NtrC family response regulator